MTTELLHDKLDCLRHLVAEMQSALVAYSGGIDSTLVLKIAHDELGERALGVTALSPTFPAVELDAATRTAQDIGARHEIVQTDQLAIPAFLQNDATRCFHCKTDLYRLMDGLRTARSTQWVLDGTNLDDLGDGRSGAPSSKPPSPKPTFAPSHRVWVFPAGTNRRLLACLRASPEEFLSPKKSSTVSNRQKRSFRPKAFDMFASEITAISHGLKSRAKIFQG
jgi:Asparagine synthase